MVVALEFTTKARAVPASKATISAAPSSKAALPVKRPNSCRRMVSAVASVPGEPSAPSSPSQAARPAARSRVAVVRREYCNAVMDRILFLPGTGPRLGKR